MKRRLGPLALLALLGSACGEQRLLQGFSEGLTRLRLEPAEFVGSVACRPGMPGALQSYVVILQEVSLTAPPDAGFTPAYAAGPVPCDQAVMFPSIAGRLYGAEIYGFDRVPSEPDVDLASARWTATCGRGRSHFEPSDAGLDPYRPTISQRGVTVPLRGCTSFMPLDGTSSQLVVDQPSALGDRRCGPGADEVYAWRGTLGGVTRGARCGEPLVFDVPRPDRYYTIDLVGLSLDGDASVPSDAGLPPLPPPPSDAGADAASVEPPDASTEEPPTVPGVGGPASDAGAESLPGAPRWRTQCMGRALAGIAARALCEPLQPLP